VGRLLRCHLQEIGQLTPEHDCTRQSYGIRPDQSDDDPIPRCEVDRAREGGKHGKLTRLAEQERPNCHTRRAGHTDQPSAFLAGEDGRHGRLPYVDEFGIFLRQGAIAGGTRKALNNNRAKRRFATS
jgi:hypothetical protein